MLKMHADVPGSAQCHMHCLAPAAHAWSIHCSVKCSSRLLPHASLDGQSRLVWWCGGHRVLIRSFTLSTVFVYQQQHCQRQQQLVLGNYVGIFVCQPFALCQQQAAAMRVCCDQLDVTSS